MQTYDQAFGEWQVVFNRASVATRDSGHPTEVYLADNGHYAWRFATDWRLLNRKPKREPKPVDLRKPVRKPAKVWDAEATLAALLSDDDL